jgi:uncharacterized protein with HEPN domain
MPPERGDPARLFDMIEASRQVAEFLAGKDRADFRSSNVLRAAVERKIEIIGEAARGVSDSFRRNHPEIPWTKIIATRHILSHEYHRINEDSVWRIATIYVPELISLIEPLVPPPPPDPEPDED